MTFRNGEFRNEGRGTQFHRKTVNRGGKAAWALHLRRHRRLNGGASKSRFAAIFHGLMTTANKITISRILMIPVFVLLAVYYGRSVVRNEPEEWLRMAAIAVFVVAAASDGIDGYIARHYNQKSQLGVVLDPIADKGLLLTAIITLTFSNWHYAFPLWFPVLIIARDMVVVSGAILLQYFYGCVHVRPSWTGKTATFLQMAAIAGAMLQIQTAWVVFARPVLLLDLLVSLAGLFTFISGVGYVKDGIRQLQAAEHAKASPKDVNQA